LLERGLDILINGRKRVVRLFFCGPDDGSGAHAKSKGSDGFLSSRSPQSTSLKPTRISFSMCGKKVYRLGFLSSI